MIASIQSSSRILARMRHKCFAAALWPAALLCIALQATYAQSESLPVFFVAVDDHDERFVFALTDSVKIARARAMISSKITDGWLYGALAAGDGGYNRDVGAGRKWSWHFEGDIDFPPITAEALQTAIGGVERDLAYWLRLGVCAIGARVESEGMVYHPGQFMNQSVRSWVGVGDDVQIAGFVIRGTEERVVLIRAAGPSLTALGVPNALSDPIIELHDQKTGAVLRTNDNWDDDASAGEKLSQAASKVGAFSWQAGSKDSALLVSLLPGIYTAVVRGKNNTSGNSLLEFYNADEPSGTRFINISARSQTGNGDDVQIAGFVIGGVQRKKILIRAGGPSLTNQGVAGALADPILVLHNQRTGATIQRNDNWDSGESSLGQATPDEIESAVKSVGASPWARGSKDAAILVEMEPGIYTAVVAGNNNTTGISLVEVFEVRSD